MEQTDAVEDHGHAVSVAGVDDVVIADGTARFSDIADAALVGSFNVVAEREESVGTQGNACVLCQPFFLFFNSQRFRLFCEEVLPCAVS